MSRVRPPILLPAALLGGLGLLLLILGVGVFVAGTALMESGLASLGVLLGCAGLAPLLVGLFAPSLYDWVRARTSSDDRALLADALADLLEMGIPLDEAVDRLGQEMRSHFASSLTRTAAAARPVAEALRAGTPLSRAIEGTGAFPGFWPPLLRAGERLERLPDALRSLARIDSRQGYVPREGLVQLFVLLPIVSGTVAFLATYILPTFVQLFEGMGLELPATTRLLVTLRGIPLVNLLIPGLIPLGLLLLFRPVREGLLTLANRFSTGGRQAQATVTSSLASGVRLDLALPETLQAARLSTSDPAFTRALQEFQAREGSTLADLLEARPDLFAPQVRWLARQGQQYGHLAEALEACGAFLEEEAEQVRRRRRVLLETAFTCAVGLVVLLVAVGTMLPLTQLTVQALMEAYLP